MSRWDDAAAWSGGGLRREVFFFGAEPDQLYGSLYSAQSPSRPDGVVVCASWGYEADRTERLAHHVALSAARLGGAGFVFHYPGHGDSHGAFLGDATMESLARAGAAAIEEASRRRPEVAWFAGGLMIGAAIACLAQHLAPTAGKRLLLIQPALSPSVYFAGLAQSTQRVTLGPGRIRDMSFAYPLPKRILEAGPEADRPVREALAAFDGEGTVVRCATPVGDDPLLERFGEVTVEGAWRFGMKDCPSLEGGVVEWLRT